MPMSERSLVPVFLCGGAGTRLWPLSRTLHPKQFLPLVNDANLLVQTLHRTVGLSCAAGSLVVCNEAHRFMAAAALEEGGTHASTILLEPEGRNTAPAIAVAALEATRLDDDPLLLVLAADHVILDTPAFKEAVLLAEAVAASGQLVTFGIVPTRPEVGYGYIRAGASAGNGIFEVAGFIEKPPLEAAINYVDSGQYYWNSGMFVFSARRYLDELRAVRPDIFSAAQLAYSKSVRDQNFVTLDANSFLSCPAESIDKAVMESASSVAMVPLDAGWSDIGSWAALYDVTEHDRFGNAVRGDVLLEDTEASYVYSNHALVATVGVKDLIVVSTADAVLVAGKQHSQGVSRIVKQLSDLQRSEQVHHRKVHRPWGSYESVDRGEGFQVKRLIIDPTKRISLQQHKFRSEHWVVVRGKARVTLGDKVLELSANESTYVAAGMTHRLENVGPEPLEVIEVQTGSYLGEDDIVRLDDDFQRG